MNMVLKRVLKNGSVPENADGSLSILNAANVESGVLQSTITLDDGSTRSVEYEVQGSAIKASYSDKVAEDAAVSSGATMSSSGVDCALILGTAGAGYLGAARTALTAPFILGGGLVVPGAALASATAGANAAS